MSHRRPDGVGDNPTVVTEPEPAQRTDADDPAPGMLHGRGRTYDLLALFFFGGRRHRVFAELVTATGARPGDRVLDVGCGTGYFTRAMARAVEPVGIAHGVDPSADAITQARRITHSSNCTFSSGYAQALDAADGSYDVVVSSLMIHHLPEPLRPRAIGEMFRVLRAGGSLLIAEFRPPSGRSGRRLIRALTGHNEMAENRIDLLVPMVQQGGFEHPQTANLRPWTYYVQAKKPPRAG
jgi:ubiquinone/menaquinone biosynthesis C-methylase UbiE